jgi:hypothetical protein
MADVDGSSILYHYLQKDLRRTNYPMYLNIVMQLVTDLGIWIHPDDYCKLPILYPYAARDHNCRKKPPGKSTDSWGQPNMKTGIQKDDNTHIKNFGQSKKNKIESFTVKRYNGKSIGKNFVASHVWRELDGSGDLLASRDHRLFSFCPNLVWLPKEISKFTDREGSVIQSFLQKLSLHIYKDIEMPNQLKPIVKQSWDLLLSKPISVDLDDDCMPSLERLSFLRINESTINTRLKKIKSLGDSLHRHGNGLTFDKPKISSKYDPHISLIEQNAALELGDWLVNLHDACC